MALTRVLVVAEDGAPSAVVSQVLGQLAGTEVLGVVPDVGSALRQAPRLPPDLVVLDAAGPETDAAAAVRRLRAAWAAADIVLLARHQERRAAPILQALEVGVLDLVAWPPAADPLEAAAALRRELGRAVDLHRTRRALRPGTASGRPSTAVPGPAALGTRTGGTITVPPVAVVAIGVSTGGPQSLAQMIPQLPGDLGVPVVLVQHMPASFIGPMVASLNNRSAIRVVEGHHGLPLQSGTVYVAPGDKQMKVVARGYNTLLALTDDPPENHCRPAADYLFRSVAAVYGARALGVIMTGMGADGREGLRQMKQQGARVLAQDQASCVVFGMPMEVIKAGLADEVVPLDRLASRIAAAVAGRAGA